MAGFRLRIRRFQLNLLKLTLIKIKSRKTKFYRHNKQLKITREKIFIPEKKIVLCIHTNLIVQINQTNYDTLLICKKTNSKIYFSFNSTNGCVIVCLATENFHKSSYMENCLIRLYVYLKSQKRSGLCEGGKIIQPSKLHLYFYS